MKAFPSEKKLYWLFRQGDKPVPNEVIEQGMDLRDYFAAKAMQSMLNDFKGVYESHTRERLTKLSYIVADAMMEERKK